MAASEPPPQLRSGGLFHDEDEAELDVQEFRQRAGFLGLLGVAFTGSVFMMTLLRPVLEPFLWALFLVITLHPLATMFESLLLCAGHLLCCCRRPPSPEHRRCPIRGEESEVEMQAAAAASVRSASSSGGTGTVLSADEGQAGGDQLLRVAFWGSCCECFSRVISVTCALAVVMGVAVAFSMFIFDGALRLQENIGIYEKGFKEIVEYTKAFFDTLFGDMPRSVVDEIGENALRSAKSIASSIISNLLEHAGMMLMEFLMLGLYVMFWLCTPMPLNTNTERIFRRYMFLKGSACVCYGICVGLLLYLLEVEMAAVFGLTSFCFSFIPEVGAFFAMLPPVPVILFDSRLDAPFLTLLIAMVGQLGLKFVFSNIIEVKLVENDATMKMHPVVTLLAVTFFGFIWGPTGMLLSVPIMTYLKVVVLSDQVPAAYRDPVLVMLEGDRKAPLRHRRRFALGLAQVELANRRQQALTRALD